MTEIVIQGIGGRMGHVLCDMIAQRDDCCVVAGIDVKDGVNGKNRNECVWCQIQGNS